MINLPARTITGICFAVALLSVPGFVAAQEEGANAGVPVQMVVTAEPKHGNDLPPDHPARRFGESYYFLGGQPPVAFELYLNQMAQRLTHQFLLTFLAKPQKKAGPEPAKLSTEIRGVDLVAQDKVCVPASREH